MVFVSFWAAPFVHFLCTLGYFPFIYNICFLLIKKKKKKKKKKKAEDLASKIILFILDMWKTRNRIAFQDEVLSPLKFNFFFF